MKLFRYLGPDSPWGVGMASILIVVLGCVATFLILPWIIVFFSWYFPFVRSFAK